MRWFKPPFLLCGTLSALRFLGNLPQRAQSSAEVFDGFIHSSCTITNVRCFWPVSAQRYSGGRPAACVGFSCLSAPNCSGRRDVFWTPLTRLPCDQSSLRYLKRGSSGVPSNTPGWLWVGCHWSTSSISPARTKSFSVMPFAECMISLTITQRKGQGEVGMMPGRLGQMHHFVDYHQR